jgi:hypothetical protein
MTRLGLQNLYEPRRVHDRREGGRSVTSGDALPVGGARVKRTECR